MNFDKIIDILMFRETGDEDNESDQPVVTTGSVVWGLLLRSSIIIILSSVLINALELRTYWWWVLIALWFFAAWPAYRQWQQFSTRMEKFEESTLCGSCRHFDPSSQLCKIYDQHVSTNYIPCEGLAWEPKEQD